MLSILTDFALAWRLLTVIPLPFIPHNPNRPAGYAAAYYALVGAILVLLLKFNTLTALPEAHRLTALIATPLLARWAVTWGPCCATPWLAEKAAAFFLAPG